MCSSSTLSHFEPGVSFSNAARALALRTGTIIAESSMPLTKPSSHFCAGRKQATSHHTLSPAAVSFA